MGDASATGRLPGAGDSLAPTDEQIDAVLHAVRALVAVTARSVAKGDDRVPPPQLRALVLVACCGRLTVGSVARGLGVHPSTATRTCDRLVGTGLLRRYDDPTDRRNLILELTATGQELVDGLNAHHREAVAALLSRLAPATRDELTTALNTFSATERPVTTRLEGLFTGFATSGGPDLPAGAPGPGAGRVDEHGAQGPRQAVRFTPGRLR